MGRFCENSSKMTMIRQPSDGLLELQKSLVKIFPDFNDVAEISPTGVFFASL